MKKNNKGFTLAELLIVVAIIAVLVGISIPIFMGQLEKSREATDLANVRSAYAVLMKSVISECPDEANGVSRSGEAGEYIYTVGVKLKQKVKGFQTTGTLDVGGIKNIAPDLNNYWIGEPEAEGLCFLMYEQDDDKEGNKPIIIWDGFYYDYTTPIGNAVVWRNSGSNVINNTCTSNDTIKNILARITDNKTNLDIKTWAAVRDPSDCKDENGNNVKDPSKYNYLMSTVDITNLSAGTKVPVIYYSKTGQYSVGYATVKKAPDKNAGKNYNVITVGPNGEYAQANNTGYTADFKSSNLVTEKTDYSTSTAAYTAYNKLLAEYNKNNSN